MFFREFMAKLDVRAETSNGGAHGEDLRPTCWNADPPFFFSFPPLKSNKKLCLGRKGEKEFRLVETAFRILLHP